MLATTVSFQGLICLSKKKTCLFNTCYWLNALYIACVWFLAVVYLASQLSGVLAGNLVLQARMFLLKQNVLLKQLHDIGPMCKLELKLKFET